MGAWPATPQRITRRALLRFGAALAAGIATLRLVGQVPALQKPSSPDYEPLVRQEDGFLLLSSEAAIPATFEGLPTAVRDATARAGSPLAHADSYPDAAAMAKALGVAFYDLPVLPPGTQPTGGYVMRHATGQIFAASLGASRLIRDGLRESALTITAEVGYTDGLIPLRAGGTPRTQPELPVKVAGPMNPTWLISGQGCHLRWREGSVLYSLDSTHSFDELTAFGVLSSIRRVSP